MVGEFNVKQFSGRAAEALERSGPMPALSVMHHSDQRPLGRISEPDRIPCTVPLALVCVTKHCSITTVGAAGYSANEAPPAHSNEARQAACTIR